MRNSVSIARTPLSIAQWVAEIHKPLHHGGVLIGKSSLLEVTSICQFIARDQYAFQFNLPLQQLSKNSKQTLTEAEILQLRGHDGFSLLEIAVERFNPTVATVAKTLNDLELDNALSILIPFGFGNVAVPQPSYLLLVTRQLGIGRVLQPNEDENNPLVIVHPSLQITYTVAVPFTVRLYQINPSIDSLDIQCY
ncbi:hypothetical protein T265_09348 [Opisthorchis viverrini]|uniref:Uncharacterized protein n=1 Tax=Opisthorchis viverrini TaxID=6198 RepID=A0A074ZAI6_OPIVI|nr:hypothetical protein T265_09348 [Opisthorchis viverrini]KER22587.1 hypothetical protein T265_09348 [Opisthorchis viverrini]